MSGDDGSRVRDALRVATAGQEPDVSRMVDRVPAMMEEAARRRREIERQNTLSAVAPLARRAIPRLAAAAALLVLASTAVGVIDRRGSSAAREGLDTLILRGTVDDDSTDPLFEAIVHPENGNG